MKVRELIETLQACNPEEEVIFSMDVGCCGDTMELECYDFYMGNIGLDRPEDPNFAFIRFLSIPGYHSCMSMGSMKAKEAKKCKGKE